MIFESKSLVFKGRFKHIRTNQLPHLLRHTGAVLKSGISYNTDLLVLGKTKDDTFAQKGKANYAEVMTEEEFLAEYMLFADVSARWERLRELLSQFNMAPPPYAYSLQYYQGEIWNKVCQHVSLWPEDEDLALALSYIDEHVAEVDNSIRSAPEEWLRHVMRGEAQPRLAIARQATFRLQYDSPPIDDQQARAIAEASALASLKILDLQRCQLSASAFAILHEAPQLEGVEVLHLQQNDFPPASLDAFTSSPLAKGLRELSISNHGQYGDQPINIKALAASPQLSGLETLSTFRGAFTLEDAQALAEPHELTALRSLRFYQPYGLNAEVLETFASSETLPPLEAFDFFGGYLSLDDCKPLLHAPFLRDVEVLKMGHNKLGDAGCTYLAEEHLFPKLRVLDLNYNEFTADGCEALAGSPQLASLEELNVNSNEIGDEGVSTIVSSPHAAGLQALAIKGCRFTEAAVEAIAQSPYMTKLKSLRLTDYTYYDEWKSAIASSPYLPDELRCLWPEFLPEAKETLSPSELMKLAASGELGALEAAIAAGSDPAKIESWDREDLERLAEGGHWACAKALLDHGLGPNIVDYWGRSLLHALFLCGGELEDEDIARWARELLAAGADASLPDHYERNALHCALGVGRMGCVELLLEAGAPINAACIGRGHGFWGAGTPLHLAICSEHALASAVVKRLLERGADHTIVDERGLQPIHAAWHQPPGWERDPYWGNSRTPNVEAIETFLAEVGDEAVHHKDNKGLTPLFYAVKTHNVEYIEALFTRGADPNHRAPRVYRRPLHLAARFGKEEVFAALIAAGAEPNVQNNKGETPLYTSSIGNSKSCIALLVEAGADPNICDKAGESPLLIASAREYGAVVAQLLEAGADPTLRTKDGLRPLHVITCVGSQERSWRSEREYQAIIEGLLAHGADPDAPIKTNTKYFGESYKKGDTPRSMASAEIAALFADGS